MPRFVFAASQILKLYSFYNKRIGSVQGFSRISQGDHEGGQCSFRSKKRQNGHSTSAIYK
jgi:hypothetical protein